MRYLWGDFVTNGMEGIPIDQILDQELIDIISASFKQIDWDENLKLKNPDAKN